MFILKFICLILWILIVINGIYEYHSSLQPIEWVLMISFIIIPCAIVYFNYKKNKKINIKYVSNLINKAHNCANIINTTCKVSPFFYNINELKKILRKLKKYEKYKIFNNNTKPSKNYRRLKKNMSNSEIDFIKRAHTQPNFFNEIVPYMHRLSQDAKAEIESLKFQEDLATEHNDEICVTPVTSPSLTDNTQLNTPNIPSSSVDNEDASKHAKTELTDYSRYYLSSELNNTDLVVAGKVVFLAGNKSEAGTVSIGTLQRVFKIGYTKAFTIMEHLSMAGILISFPDKSIYVLNPDLSMEDLIYRCMNYDLSTHKIHSPTSHAEISQDFDNMDGHEFECFCADLLKRLGYMHVKITKESRDYGIDILAEKDDISYAIQCKCYKGNIGTKAIQEAYSGKNIYNRDIGVVITNRYFTPSAIKTAEINKIKLWNRDKLLKFIEQANKN